MNGNTGRFRLLLALALAGLLFSGYLSSVRFFSDTCAFNEPCPYFLGYPACYFGFVMFFIMTAAMAAYFAGAAGEKVLRSVLAVSGAGILFAGYFTLRELPQIFTGGISSYVLGLPTCAYGLIVYIAMFAIALTAWRARATVE
jgi:hypothetical protein